MRITGFFENKLTKLLTEKNDIHTEFDFRRWGQEHKHSNFCEVINQFRYNRRGHSIF